MKLHKILSLFTVILFCIAGARAQSFYITGNTQVNPGEIHTYIAHISYNNDILVPNISWSVLKGTITRSGIDASGNRFCNVNWNQGQGLGKVTAYDATSNQTTFLNVQIGVPTISPVSQTLSYGATPTQLCISYGTASILNYQWQSSTDNTNWSFVTNTSTACYQPPAIFIPNLYYRCLLQLSNGSVYSPVAGINIPVLKPGVISASTLNPTYNTTITLTATPATGGLCYISSYIYEWEVAYADGVWRSIGVSENFPVSPFSITEDVYLRRKVTCSGQTEYSNTLFIDAGAYPQDWDLAENLNFVREYTILKKGATNWTDATTLAMGDKLVTTTYLDGLGRPIQTVDKRSSSPDGQTWKDIVKPYEYDAAGRTVKDYLPYPSITNPGGFEANAINEQTTFIRNFFGEPSTAPTWSVVEYDNSPLNRVLKAMQPGQSWAGSSKGITSSYEFNDQLEKVHIWPLAYSSAAIPTPSLTDIYASGKLSKLVTTDEKNNKVITYTDLSGNTVLRKVQEAADGPGLSNEHSGWACTYYVYDDFGQLRFIIPPKAVKYLDETGNWTLTQNITDELCFKYVYDEKGRLIIKKQPGAGEASLVYDKKDRLVLSQDALQKQKSQWSFSLYDDMNRTVATGLFDNAADRPAMQTHVNTLNNSVVSVYPWVRNGVTVELKVENPVAGSSGTSQYCNGCNAATLTYNTITHYDDYSFPGAQSFNTNNVFAYNAAHPFAEPAEKSNRTTGMVTGEKTRVLDNDNNPLNDKFTFSTAYYDENGRSLQNLVENISLSVDYSSNQYDFAGKLLSTYVNHTYNGQNYTITSKSEFDKMGRPVKFSKNFNNTSYRGLAAYEYNELGQVKKMRVGPYPYTTGGADEIESLSYDYNINGWITGINKDYALSTNNYSQWDRYFGLYLGYDNREGLFADNQLGGNITGTIWKSQGDNSPRKYDYTYDRLDRFTSAIFKQKKRPGDGWLNTETDFSVYMQYEDLNGNIKSMKHMGVIPGTNGGMVVDNLQYNYKPVPGMTGLNGNKLASVLDQNHGLTTDNGILGDFKDGANSGDDYEYDINGNLVKDLNKNIKDNSGGNGVIYNYLNKPEKVIIPGKSTIEFTYDASGDKLTKKVTYASNDVKLTTYIGDFIYETNIPASGTASYDVLQFVLHEEGRLKIITPHTHTGAIDYDLDAGTFGIIWPGGRKGVFEYFIKDHLGSTRMVLTEEVQKEYYYATMETNMQSIEAPLFGAVDISGSPTGTNEWIRTRETLSPWPGNSSGVTKLTATDPNKTIGPNMLLKVMAGDMINAKTDYFYFNNTSIGNGNPVGDLLNSFVTALSVPKAGTLNSHNSGNVQGLLNNDIPFTAFINGQTGAGPNTPKAYLNILFFDEQFRFIDRDIVTPDVGSGCMPVNSAGTPSLLLMQKKAPKNGWVFVYLSNESNENVYFDNFAVTQEHSRIAEENHYYPYGLKIAGISSNAFNKPENKYKFTGQIFNDEGDLNWYDFTYRNHDPQIGRFVQVDPLGDFYPHNSSYAYAENDVIRAIDLEGLEKYVVTEDWVNNRLRRRRVQATWDNQSRDYIDYDFKNKDGSDVTDQDVMVIRINRNRDWTVRNSNYSYKNSLSRDESRVLRNARRSIVGVNGSEYDIRNGFGVDRDIRPSVQVSPNLIDFDGDQRIPLITNLNLPLSNFGFFAIGVGDFSQQTTPTTTNDDGSPVGDLRLNDMIRNASKNSEFRNFLDLPNLIIEDGGIRRILITVTQIYNSNGAPQSFKDAFEQALRTRGDQIKNFLQRNGVRNITITVRTNPLYYDESEAEERLGIDKKPRNFITSSIQLFR